MNADYIEVNGGKVYYQTAGEGEAVTFVHAGFVDSRMWDDQWEALARHYRVIRFDMRGFGRSDVVEGPVSRWDDLRCLLTRLGIERTYLVGCSMGGEAALDLALEKPEMVAGLVLVSTAPGGFELQGEPPRYLFDMIGALQQGDTAHASELQLRIWMDGQYREPAQVDPVVRQRAAEMNRIAVENGTWLNAGTQSLDPPAITRLGEIHLPTLIVAGALDHPEILRAADVMVDEIDSAEKVIIPDSAHLPNMEKPAEFNQAVLRFLR